MRFLNRVGDSSGKSSKTVTRWLYLVAGTTILLFCGVVYAWSIFSAQIAKEYPEWTQAELSVTFTIMMSLFCVGSMIGGMLSKKLSARLCISLSAMLFLFGFWLASNLDSLFTLYLGFGVLCGFASGFTYTVVLGTVGLWFSDKRGLSSGILLMGFGISSFLVGKVYQAITPDEIGAWRHFFVIMGMASCAVLTACGMLIKKPSRGVSMSRTAMGGSPGLLSVEVPAGEMLKTRHFWLYYLWTTLLSASGLVIVSQAGGIAGELDKSISAGTITTIVGLISVSNGVGRILVGRLFDKLGRRQVMHLVSFGFLAVSAALTIALYTRSFLVLLVGVLLGGLSYGGVNPTNSAFISTYFGLENYPLNLSLINTNLMLSSFGSTLAGVLFDQTHSYRSTYFLLFGLALVACTLAMAIDRYDKRN